MTWQDSTNGIFEILGSLFVWRHCYRLLQDRQVKGVSWVATLFFSLWGWWNIYYYPHLGQWASFVGGLCIVSANTIWLSMMIYYIKNDGGWKELMRRL